MIFEIQILKFKIKKKKPENYFFFFVFLFFSFFFFLSFFLFLSFSFLPCLLPYFPWFSSSAETPNAATTLVHQTPCAASHGVHRELPSTSTPSRRTTPSPSTRVSTNYDPRPSSLKSKLHATAINFSPPFSPIP